MKRRPKKEEEIIYYRIMLLRFSWCASQCYRISRARERTRTLFRFRFRSLLQLFCIFCLFVVGSWLSLSLCFSLFMCCPFYHIINNVWLTANTTSNRRIHTARNTQNIRAFYWEQKTAMTTTTTTTSSDTDTNWNKCKMRVRQRVCVCHFTICYWMSSCMAMAQCELPPFSIRSCKLINLQHTQQCSWM